MLRPFSFIERAQSNALWLAEHLLGAERFGSLFAGLKRKHEAALLERLRTRGPGREIVVDRVENLDPATFRRKYHRPGVPVIFAGAAKNWKCCEIWTPRYFAENYGNEECSITSYGDDRVLSLAETVDGIKGRKLRGSQFSRLVHNHKELLAHLDLDYLRPFTARLSHTTSYQFFIGPEGVQTPLHAGGTNNFHIQIYGEKTWRIVDIGFNPVIRPKVTGSPTHSSDFDPSRPDDRFPADRHIDIYKAKLYKGDILFVPAYYWHHVTYDTDSIASGWRWVTPADVLRAAMMFSLSVTATNPPFWGYYLANTRGVMKPFYGAKKAPEAPPAH